MELREWSSGNGAQGMELREWSSGNGAQGMQLREWSSEDVGSVGNISSTLILRSLTLNLRTVERRS